MPENVDQSNSKYGPFLHSDLYTFGRGIWDKFPKMTRVIYPKIAQTNHVITD